MQNRDPPLDYCLASLGKLCDAKQRPSSGLLSGITKQSLWCKTDSLLWITVWQQALWCKTDILLWITVWHHLASFAMQNRDPPLDYCLATLGKLCDAKQRPSSGLLSGITWQSLWCKTDRPSSGLLSGITWQALWYKTETLLWITVWHHLASFVMQNRDSPLDYCLASLGKLCDAKQRPSSGLLSGITWQSLWCKTDRPSSGLLSGITWQALWYKTETLLWITVWHHLASFVMQNRDSPLDYCLASLGKLCDAKQRPTSRLLTGI